MKETPGRRKKSNEAGEPVGKPRLFCEHYVADTALNGALAARKAGYVAKHSADTAWRLLQDERCIAYIEKLMSQRSDRTRIDADWVLLRMQEIDGMELLDIFEPDFTLKPLDQWPITWRKYISSFEMAELVASQGDAKALAKALKKIKGPDKQKNLEMIGKHTGIGAFRDQVEHTGNISYTVVTGVPDGSTGN